MLFPIIDKFIKVLQFMINHRFPLFFSLAMMANISTNAQRDQGGFISPGDSLMKFLPAENNIYLPVDGFTFYDVPNGEFKGKILPGPPFNSLEIDTLLTSTITGTQIREQALNPEFYFETFGNRYYLSFDQRQDDYVRVLSNQYKGWIAIDEIKKKGFKLISWMEFYGESKRNTIHPTEKIVPIHAKPYPDAPIVATADELFSEITTIGKCEGSFCMVNVIQFKNPYDPSKTKEENILRKYKGWIRIIDEEGKPLVAHNEHDS